MPEVGDIAPEVQLQDNHGRAVTLSELRGKTVVLYFYPRADTPGCTVEACAFRDSTGDFDAANAVILGVSPDTVNAQQSFATKFDLPFRLLADADHVAAEAYGVWGEKKNYGKSYMGVNRSTFIIGPDGKITKIFPKVKVEGHAAEVLAAVKAAGSSEA